MKKPQYLDVPSAQLRRAFSLLTIGMLVLYGFLDGGDRLASAQSLSLVWSDEFNGASIDLSKWTFDIGNGAQAGNPGWGNNELEYYTSNSANAYVTNGFLHIRAQLQVTNATEGTFNYTSARMKTQGLFNKTYGRIEWRASLPKGTGFWPALWMLGTNFDSIGWPGCGEIDVVENNGANPTFVQGSIHSGSDATGIFNFHGGDSVTNFHVYDLDWTNNSIIWSVDGVAYETQTAWSSSTGSPYPFPFNQPFFFLMNVAVGGDYVGDPGTNAINPSLPGEMVIDYIRVFDYNIVSVALQATPSSGGTVSGGGTYYSGTNLTVCASPNASCYSFANWTLNGNAVSTSPCYTFPATNSEALVANFTPLAYYTISTSSSPAGGGSTSGGETVPCGSNVTVCASAIPCYSFTSWTLNGTVVSTTPCYTFAAASNEALVANFVPTASYTINTSSSPAGGGSTSGGGTIGCGSNVTVCATANPCYSFVNWTDQYSNVVSATACYTFTPNGNANLAANFIPIPDTITTNSSPAGAGTISGGGTVNCGSNVTVCAMPTPCYRFVDWTANGNVVGTSACYSFTATGNEAVVANFAPISYGGSIAGSLSNLHSFSYLDGDYPVAGLVLGSDGNFYGMTEEGGTSGQGTVFRMTPGGTLTNLHSFIYTSSDGAYPTDGLVQGSDSNFYGTTQEGGAGGQGTVFRITPGGSLTFLHSFSYNDGAYPVGGLVLGSDSNFYGTTEVGGANGFGTVFGITPGGTLTTLHSFGYGDGGYPLGGLVLGSDSNFYGTTYYGGTSGSGTVFRISSNSSFASLYSFSGPDGAFPAANLIQGSDGNFYGTTTAGGTFSYGAVFRISPGGSLTDLWSFSGCSDGADPEGALLQGDDGSLYGTTSTGSGSSPYGTVFRLDPSGYFTNLWAFTGGADGANSYATLVQGNDHALYGTASGGGAHGDGAVFRIAAGLCASVLTPNSADFSSAGGSGSVAVAATTTNCVWAATSNNGFITITSGSGGTGSGTVSYTVAADADTNNFGRTGTMTIAGLPFTVAQASLGCSFMLGSTNASFDAAGGSGTVTVNVSGSNCAWTATSNTGFITITSGSGGSGNGSVTYTVSANSNNVPRTGTLTIAGQTFTVTQGGFGCSAVLTVNSSPAGGGTTGGGSTVGCGSNVTVCAMPNTCYSFVNWTVNSNVVSTGACSTVAVPSNETLVANFAPILSTAITTSSSPLAGGSTSGGGTVACGSSVTVCATASGCYSFVNWTVNGNAVSASACYTIAAPSNETLVANFAPTLSSYTITAGSSSADGGAAYGGGLVACGSTVTVCAVASPCYSFVNWTDQNSNVVSTSLCYSFAAASNEELVANFAAVLSGTRISGSLTNLWSFTGGRDGANSYARLTQGSDGNLYGTTYDRGTNGYGTVFRISASGSLTTLWSFANGVDGANPYAGLVQGRDGNFYGTTSGSGSGPSANGTVFRISTNGGLTNLWSFSGGADGAIPYAGLMQGSDGNFYGTTSGSGSGPGANGTVFRIGTNGGLANLWSFSGGTDGANPYGGLVQGSDGNFYGTTFLGGANGNGAVFRISASGSLTTLWSFTNGLDGANSYATLVQGGDGSFYGTTSQGGANGNGTVFRISPTGNLTNLCEFTGCGDGGMPFAGLVQGSDGNFYGTTSGPGSGPSGFGTVFRISANGSLTTLYSFSTNDGANPYAGVVQGSDGSFYGTTYAGGAGGYGTVFQLSVLLNPPANQISSIQLMGTNLVVRIPSVAGEMYQLQYSSSLTLTNWTNVSSATMSNSIGGLLSLTNLGGAMQPQGFYRFAITP